MPMQGKPDIATRIECLERENRRWRRGTVLLSVAMLSAITLSLARPDDGLLEGKGLVLRDDAGVEYASLQLDSQGTPLLLIRKDESHAAITLSGPALHLRAPDGKRSVFLGVDTRGKTKLELTGENVMSGVRAVVHEDESSGVYLLDQEGYDRVTMETHPDAGSLVSLRGERSSLRAAFGLDQRGNASAILLDTSGRRRVGMLVQADGTPLVSIEDELGRPRANLTMKFDGTPRLEMLREDGQPSFTAP